VDQAEPPQTLRIEEQGNLVNGVRPTLSVEGSDAISGERADPVQRRRVGTWNQRWLEPLFSTLDLFVAFLSRLELFLSLFIESKATSYLLPTSLHNSLKTD